MAPAGGAAEGEVAAEEAEAARPAEARRAREGGAARAGCCGGAGWDGGVGCWADCGCWIEVADGAAARTAQCCLDKQGRGIGEKTGERGLSSKRRGLWAWVLQKQLINPYNSPMRIMLACGAGVYADLPVVVPVRHGVAAFLLSGSLALVPDSFAFLAPGRPSRSPARARPLSGRFPPRFEAGAEQVAVASGDGPRKGASPWSVLPSAGTASGVSGRSSKPGDGAGGVRACDCQKAVSAAGRRRIRRGRACRRWRGGGRGGDGRGEGGERREDGDAGGGGGEVGWGGGERGGGDDGGGGGGGCWRACGRAGEITARGGGDAVGDGGGGGSGGGGGGSD